MKTKITILMTAILLNACGSGSGGDSSSTPSDGGGCIVNCGGTGGGGSPTSNNGNATYYSLTTYPMDPPNEDQASASSGAWLITNKFFFKVTDAGQGHFDVGVFQPTCYVSSSGSYKDYAVIQLSGVIGQNSLSIRVQGGGAIIEDDAFDANTPDKKRVGSAATISGTCSQGKMNLSNGGVIFSNGEALVCKDANGELYAGFSSDVTLKTGTHANSDIGIDDGVLATHSIFIGTTQPMPSTELIHFQ